jgi:serine/threonine protein phosphatase PrpC
MRFRVGARTDVGRVREGNEDSYMVHEPLYAVADGMGGHQGGEVASNLALQALERIAEEPAPDGDSAPQLAEVVREANRLVLQRASGDPALAGMGTTLTAVLAGTGGRVHVAHVGDSRAYLLRNGELTQLTRDQTVVQRLVDEGRITQQEAEIHPQRSILTNALGVDREIQVDEAAYELTPGDRLLLCSDGLSGMVPEDEIRRILREREDPQAACDALVEAANAAGGQDNITVVILDALEDQAVPAAETTLPTAAAGAEPAGPPVSEAAEEASPTPSEPAADVEADASEPSAGGRYEFAAPARARRRWLRTVAWLVVALLVIGGGLYAVKRFFIDSQYFVGVSGGNVAIFRGIPAQPLGLDLATVERETELPAAEVSRFSAWQSLDLGITADSLQDAESIVSQMKQDVEAADRADNEPQNQEPGGQGP